jgi:hypothetical protein
MTTASDVRTFQSILSAAKREEAELNETCDVLFDIILRKYWKNVSEVRALTRTRKRE